MVVVHVHDWVIEDWVELFKHLRIELESVEDDLVITRLQFSPWGPRVCISASILHDACLGAQRDAVLEAILNAFSSMTVAVHIAMPTKMIASCSDDVDDDELSSCVPAPSSRW